MLQGNKLSYRTSNSGACNAHLGLVTGIHFIQLIINSSTPDSVHVNGSRPVAILQKSDWITSIHSMIATRVQEWRMIRQGSAKETRPTFKTSHVALRYDMRSHNRRRRAHTPPIQTEDYSSTTGNTCYIGTVTSVSVM